MGIKELRQAYNRFKINYRNSDGGINLYAGYDKDLEVIMQWVGEELVGLDIPIWDCNWEPPIEENEDDI